MKAFFAATFLLLVVLSAVAWRVAPRPAADGRIPLSWSSDDNPLRREQIEPFNLLHPQFRLTLDPNNAELQKVIVQSMAGVGPDLFDCWSGFALSAFVKADIAWDVTDELAKRGIDVAAETWPAVHPHAIYEGRTYGFPVNAAVNGILYHKDIIESAGVTMPRGPSQWDAFVPTLQRLTVRDSSGRVQRYGLLMDWENNYLQFIYQWGGRMYSPDGTRCTLDSPEAIVAVQFMQDLVHTYRVAPDPAGEAGMAAAGGWGGTGVITLFGAQKGATALAGRWWLCRLRMPDYQHLRLGAIEAPHAARHVFVGYGKATLINRNSPRREHALKFLEYLHSAEYNHLINHQADGVGPVMKYTQDDAFLNDPAYPQEDFNHVWRDMLRRAEPEQVSPFMNGAVMQRLMKTQLDQVKAGSKSAAAAMRDAAREVNAIIQENLRRDPSLRARYEALTLTPSPSGRGSG